MMPIDPPGDLDGVPRHGRLDVLCLRPIHHVLEYEALFRLTAALRERAPDVVLHLHLRSALRDDAPFSRLPAHRVTRLTERGGRGELAAGCRRLIHGWEPGAAALVLAPPAGWRRVKVGAASIQVAPFDFHSPGCGEGEDCVAAGQQFLAALRRETPLWRVALGAPPPLARDAPGLRFLIHQARFHIGDVLWLTPLLRALHHLFRQPVVTLVGPPVAVTVLAGNPHFSELVVYHPRDGESGQRRVLAALAGRPFDAALFAFARRSESRWLMEAIAAAGVPRRINLEYHDAFLDSRRPWEAATHEGWLFWGTMPSPRLLLHALDPLLAGDAPAIAERVSQKSVMNPPGALRSLTPGPSPGGRGGSPVGGIAEEDGLCTVIGAGSNTVPYNALPVRLRPPSPPGRGAGGEVSTGIPPTFETPSERLELHLAAAAQRRADELLAGRGLAGRPFAVLAPGGFSSQRWPAASFARLAVALAKELHLGVLIEGSPDEVPLLHEVEAAVATAGEGGNVHVCQDPLDVFAALLARARLVVTNDSAPLHFAAALGVPALYFAQREKLVHSCPASAKCRALYDGLENDLGRISVEQALGAIREMESRGVIDLERVIEF
jgi:ADP-heptose:LPS heptosyltransferase